MTFLIQEAILLEKVVLEKRKVEKWKREKNGENSSPLMLLPVDCLNGDRLNADIRANETNRTFQFCLAHIFTSVDSVYTTSETMCFFKSGKNCSSNT